MSLRPAQGDETPSLQQPPSMEAFALPFVIPSVPGFPATLRRTRSRVRLSVRKGAWSSPTPPSFTGNPGQPRDLQFSGPFMEMFFDGGVPAARKSMDFRNQLAPKIWSLPLTLQPSRQYHVLQAAGPRAIAARWRLPVAEGHWRERRVAERYPVPHSFSLYQPHPSRLWRAFLCPRAVSQFWCRPNPDFL
jgi:hypothetical protein